MTGRSAKESQAVVALDGVAGVGKSTVARKLAIRLNFVHLNSGALYRAVALRAIREGMSLQDEDAVTQLASRMKFAFRVDDSGNTVLWIDGQRAGNEIASQEAGKGASEIGTLPRLREVITEVQRKAADEFPLVVEGRDAGTVVFPRAAFKFFLDASVDVRVERRMKELREKGVLKDANGRARTAEEIRAEIIERDHRDMTRTAAPLVKADDAVLVDTSAKTADDVAETLAEIIRRGGGIQR